MTLENQLLTQEMLRKIKRQFREYLLEKGLNMTRQREAILEDFLYSTSHPSVKELHNQLQRSHPQIGYNTVNRNLKLLTEFGIAEERCFGDGTVRYDPKTSDEHHHHFICTTCNTITDFKETQVEELQKDVARQHDFEIDSTLLALYGLCARCSGGAK